MNRGLSLPQALAVDETQFPRPYRVIVEAGLRSGRLPAALEAVSQYAQSLVDLRQKIGVALVYPLIVVLLVYGLMVVVSVDLTNRFLEFHQAFGLSSTGALRVLGGLANTVAYWVWIPPAVLVVLLLWWMRTDSSQLLGFQGAARPLGWIPGVRRIRLNYCRACFADLLGLLIEHQVPLADSLILAADTTGEARLQASARVAAEAARYGETLRQDFPGLEGLPPYLRWLIIRGQQQAGLAGPLRVAAETYRRRTVDAVQWLKLAFPIAACVVIAGGATLLYALSLFVPLTGMLWRLAG